METFSAQMSVSLTPEHGFINFYNSIMLSYLEQRKQQGDKEPSEYDQLAETVIDMSEDNMQNIIAKSHSLYIFPQSNSSQSFDPNDFYKQKSNYILNHEFVKWFGTEKIAKLLISETVENTEAFLRYFFSLTFFSLQLDLSHQKKDSLYLAISPGKCLKKWLSEFEQYDMKTKLNLLKDKPSVLFDSCTTFVVKTDILNHDDIDLFLEKNINTIIKYERMAWVGNVDVSEDKLQWPSDLNELSTFKNWFNIKVYDDSCQLI